jgi:hypothetical protein
MSILRSSADIGADLLDDDTHNARHIVTQQPECHIALKKRCHFPIKMTAGRQIVTVVELWVTWRARSRGNGTQNLKTRCGAERSHYRNAVQCSFVSATPQGGD